MYPTTVRKFDRPQSILVLFFVIGCILAIAPIVNSVVDSTNNKDLSLWYEMGLVVRAGGPLYQEAPHDEPKYMYPPTLAVLVCAPLSYLGPVGFTTVLSLVTAASWAVSVWASTTLIIGNWQHSRALYLLPGLAIAPYVWDIQLLGQSNLLLLALTLLSFVALRNQRHFVSGALFGAAVAMKVFPLPAIAYFIVRRQWKGVAAVVVVTALMAWAIPGTIRGFDRTNSELKQWAELMVADQSGQKIAGRSSVGFTRRNQSLVSVSHRLLRQVDAGDDYQKPLYINFAKLSPREAQLVGYGIGLLLGLILLLACRFRPAPSPKCEGIEIAMVCTLAPLCSPLAWTYFFCWLLVAWTGIGASLVNPTLSPSTRRIVVCCGSIAGLLLLSAISEQFDPTLQAFGVTAWGSVLLFLTLAYVRSQLPNTPCDSNSCSSINDSQHGDTTSQTTRWAMGARA